MFCVPLEAPGPLRALSGGARGPNNQTKDTATLRPAVPRVLRLRAGGRWTTRPQNTTDSCAESLCRDRRVFRNHGKIQCFLTLWHLPRSKPAGTHWFSCFLRAAASPKRAPRRVYAQNPRKYRSDLGCVFVVFLFALCVFCWGALDLWLALFWPPLGALRVSLGPLWGPLARGQERPEVATVPS